MTFRLGTNLPAASSGSRTFYFADLMRQRDPKWGPAKNTHLRNCPVDADGNPTADCGVYIVEGMDADPEAIPAGDYFLAFDGTASVRGPGEVIDQYTEGGITSAVIRVPDTSHLPPEKRSLNFVLSFSDAKRPDGTPGIINPRLYLPGHDAIDEYNRGLIETLSNFHTLRWMDATCTNSAPAHGWNERVQPRDLQSGPKGMAWEHVFRISRAAGADCWINIPHWAGDNYIRNLAELAKAELAPGQRLYVEWSNEVWNAQFPQYHDNMRAAKESDGFIAYPGDANPNNPTYCGFRRIVSMTGVVSRVFREVFGDAAMGDKVRVILGHQIMWPDQLPDMLKWYRHRIGEPSRDIWGVASGAYLNIGDREKEEGLTHDDIIGTFRARLPELERHVAEASELADEWMLKYGAYELGTHLTGKESLPQKIATQATEDMGDIVAEVVAMFGRHADFGNWYTLSSPHSENGCWALTNQFGAMTEKLDAAISAAKATPREAPYVVPADPTTTREVVSRRVKHVLEVIWSDGTVETFDA